ncbi:MAG: BlaI/MecI/CopY family transcriptional regulator [Planctomycetota bacterium]
MRLTPGEMKVMRLLWEHGEMTPPEIGERYKPSIKDAALRACLAVLLEKGHVERRREGRAYVYGAVTQQKRAFKSMLGELLENFCDGSARQLMMNLAEQESLSEDDLREIKRLAKSSHSPRGKGK